MMPFVLCAALIVALACAFLLPPLWSGRRRAAVDNDRQAANLAIFRDQLAELERERQEGLLAAADFDHARQELQRRLLDEAGPAADAAAGAAAPSRKAALALLVLLPLGAALGYALLGNPAARTAPPPPPANAGFDQKQIDDLVARLAERLRNNPDDTKGWLTLARSYKALGRYEESVKAYVKAEKVINDDPDLLASYAEAVAMANGQNLAGKPLQLIERALKINPKHVWSLYLAGAAAMQANDIKKGIAYWETALPLADPDSELGKAMREGVDEAKRGR